MGRVSVVLEEGSVKFLSMGGGLRSARFGLIMQDQSTPFIGLKFKRENRVHEIVFKFKDCRISGLLRDVVRVKNVVKALGMETTERLGILVRFFVRQMGRNDVWNVVS